MTSTCPTCGREQLDDDKDTSNSRREHIMKIPEHHWMMFHLMFSKMNIKFGMEGSGELANLLPKYQDELPIDYKHFRYVNATIMAQIMLVIEQGATVNTRTEPGGTKDYNGNDRLKVFAEVKVDDGDPIDVEISDCAYEESAKYICDYLDDVSQRYATLT